MSHETHPPTPEQIEIVRWAASLGAITAEALAVRADVTLASARARLSAVQRRRLLVRERPLAGRPALFAATRAGLRICDARRMRTCQVKASNAGHLIACAMAAARLERCYPCHRVTGERELRRDEQEHGRALASAPLDMRYGQERVHRPDLVLWPRGTDGGLPVVVEVELTVKAPRRLVEICRAWAYCRAVAGVLYLAPKDVEQALLRAVEQAAAHEQVIVVPLNSLAGLEASVEGESGCKPKG